MTRFVKHTALTLVFTLMMGFAAWASPPLPPGHGEGTDQPAPAPIGGGLVVLMLLAGAYGAKKVYQMRKRMDE